MGWGGWGSEVKRGRLGRGGGGGWDGRGETEGRGGEGTGGEVERVLVEVEVVQQVREAVGWLPGRVKNGRRITACSH